MGSVYFVYIKQKTLICGGRYAFDELGLAAVNADTIIKNTHSQHVLEKAGFKFVKEDGNFKYYRIER